MATTAIHGSARVSNAEATIGVWLKAEFGGTGPSGLAPISGFSNPPRLFFPGQPRPVDDEATLALLWADVVYRSVGGRYAGHAPGSTASAERLAHEEQLLLVVLFYQPDGQRGLGVAPRAGLTAAEELRHRLRFLVLDLLDYAANPTTPPDTGFDLQVLTDPVITHDAELPAVPGFRRTQLTATFTWFSRTDL